jgi:hypothetical protein
LLAGHAPEHTHSDAQGAANHASSHTVYDSSSGLNQLVHWLQIPGCSQTGLAVRYKESKPPLTCFPMWDAARGGYRDIPSA